MPSPTSAEFVEMVRQNPVNRAILDRLPQLAQAAPDVHLVAGALFGTAWNVVSGRPPTADIHDYDISYWHPDTSYEAEDAVIRHTTDVLGDLDARIEVRNQARVHLWFNPKFGLDRPALRHVRESIDQFLVDGLVRSEGAGLPAPLAVADDRRWA